MPLCSKQKLESVGASIAFLWQTTKVADDVFLDYMPFHIAENVYRIQDGCSPAHPSTLWELEDRP